MSCKTLLVMLAAFSVLSSPALGDGPPEPTRTPLVRVVDLNIGESRNVELCDGSKATVKLLGLQETRDTLRDAVRRAVVAVEVNGRPAELVCSTYHLPETVAGVRIDCSVTKGYTTASSKANVWGLVKDARLRLWPAGSPLVAPKTFIYPVRQKWFAGDTQMANEPCFVDGGEIPGAKSIYYHYGLDFGGAEGMIDVVAAAEGLVVSVGTTTLPGYEETPVHRRYDVVYVLDDRGWYYRYSHLKSIDGDIRLGKTVRRGQKIGVLGKEGGSGGWSHMHFDVTARQPSGLWGTQAAYAFAWEAYLRERKPKVIAVARPHHLVWTGQKVMLDARRSWSAAAGKLRYQWTLSDGSTASGPTVVRAYDAPGQYSEILKVTDSAGRIDYDFAVVQVHDKSRPDLTVPTVHAAFSPTLGITPGEPVTFKVRSFDARGGGEVWHFGDGSPPVTVKSDGNANVHAPDGYAVTAHRFAEAGDYLVRVEHTSADGVKAVGRLHVRVGRKGEVRKSS